MTATAFTKPHKRGRDKTLSKKPNLKVPKIRSSNPHWYNFSEGGKGGTKGKFEDYLN
jgi:hypothetical protein